MDTKKEREREKDETEYYGKRYRWREGKEADGLR